MKTLAPWSLVCTFVLTVACDDGSKDAEIARLKAELGKTEAAAEAAPDVAAAGAPVVTARPEPKVTAQKMCEHFGELAKAAGKELDVVDCVAQGQPHQDSPKFQEQARCILKARTYAEERLKCQGKEAVVKTFKGKGQQTVRPFTIGDKWEIRWDANGAIFQAMLYTADGDMVDIVANQQGKGTGSAYRPKGGEYYLQMNAMGGWTVEVVQLP
ncbi:MAG: hypothetical protein ACRBN8_46870 [Nannocystales bacterium]